MVDAEETGSDELKRGWGMILASTLGVAFGLVAMPFYVLGAFFEPLEHEFGWSRGAIGAAFLAMNAGIVTTNVGAGWMADRFGPVRVIMTSLVGLAAGYIALAALTYNLPSFYAFNFLFAVLGIGSGAVVFNTLIAAHFSKRRGLAIAISMTGTGISAVIGPSYVTWLIGLWGWRWAYVGLAALSLGIALPAAVIFLRRYVPDRADRQVHRELGKESTGLSPREVLHNYRSYVIASALAMALGAASGIAISTIPLLRDLGFTASAAARIAGSYGVFVIVGRIFVGLLLDRLSGPIVAPIFLGLAAGGTLLMELGRPTAIIMVVSLGLVGLAAGAEVDLAPYLCARYFGVKNFGKIYAGVFIFVVLIGGLAPPMFGRIYDMKGSYTTALYGATAAFLFAALLLSTLGPYPSTVENSRQST
jgi:MFS family permease